ncbi:MAG: FMN-binding protein [Elusimicrobia bacterium]|nr:FMN-binding protein [Elusimicrobiota bacterium]
MPLFGLLSALLLGAGESQARLLLSQKQALGLAFPAGAAVERRTAYLTDAQVARAESLAKTKVESKVWTYYVGTSSGAAAGWAYFDRVIVRTMPATVMAAVAPDGTLRFLEVLTFDEPDDYRASARWLAQLKARPLDRDLRIGGLLRNQTGATLTSSAFSDSARRLLAVHAVLTGKTE